MFEGVIEERTPFIKKVTRRDVMALIAEGEGLRVEFKRHFSSPKKKSQRR